MSPHHIFRLVVAVCALTLGLNSAVADDSAIPAASFFARYKLAGASLSPDGANAALLMQNAKKDTVLLILPTAGGEPRLLASHPGRDVSNVRWVNSKRILYSAFSRDASPPDMHKYQFGSGPFAINIDGSKPYNVGSAFFRRQFHSVINDENSNEVYVTVFDRRNEGFTGYVLYRLNTMDGNLTRVPVPDDMQGLLVDEGGVPRVAVTGLTGVRALQYNDPKTGKWRKLTEFSPSSNFTLSPRLMTRDGELYVLSNNGRNTQGLYRFDIQTAKLDPEPVVGLEKFDFNGSIILGPDRTTALGAQYETTERVTTWFDEGMKNTQAKIDGLLPSTINNIHLGRNGRAEALLVFSYSDVDPGAWYLYRAATQSLTPLGKTLPDIHPLQMSGRKMIRYQARDGMEIPAYLTLPKTGNGKRLPMVVMVHEGPWQRGGHMEWNAGIQFLASRGYVVLEPEFRGSTGFGRAHFVAGWKQWGLAMQDDLADGAQWAIGQGYADPKRICIQGADYGGYAVLMGLMRNPELFSCGIDAWGVTDINLVYDMRWSGISDESKTYFLPELIGDQIANQEKLKAASPLANADRIKQPLLMIYNDSSRQRANRNGHGEQFYEANKKFNPKLEWFAYPTDVGDWDRTEYLIDYWTRIEKFLGQNIGGR